VRQSVRFTPESRHQKWNAYFGVVRQFKPELGHENSGSGLTLPLPPRQPTGAQSRQRPSLPLFGPRTGRKAPMQPAAPVSRLSCPRIDHRRRPTRSLAVRLGASAARRKSRSGLSGHVHQGLMFYASGLSSEYLCCQHHAICTAVVISSFQLSSCVIAGSAVAIFSIGRPRPFDLLATRTVSGRQFRVIRAHSREAKA
jgi:hypothetical protein